jgi:hypothetical protein
MIRYSSRRGRHYQTNPRAPAKFPSSLETEYRELQDLRERVRKAEAAARNASTESKKLGLLEGAPETEEAKRQSRTLGLAQRTVSFQDDIASGPPTKPPAQPVGMAESDMSKSSWQKPACTHSAHTLAKLKKPAGVNRCPGAPDGETRPSSR